MVEGTAVVLLFVVDPLSLVTPESTTLKSPVITGLDFTGLNFTGLNLTGLDFTGHHLCGLNPALHKPPCG